MVKINNNIEINKNKTQIYKTINIYYNDIYDICLKILKKFKINVIQDTNNIKYQIVYNNSHFIVYEHNKYAILTHYSKNAIETDISIIKYICDKNE